MFGLENRSETLIFMSRHFDETMTILISEFLHFRLLDTTVIFKIAIIKIHTYSKKIKNNMSRIIL